MAPAICDPSGDAVAGAYCVMPDKTFLVKLRSGDPASARAATVEMQGDHLVFLAVEGTLAALFLLEIVLRAGTQIEPPTS